MFTENKERMNQLMVMDNTNTEDIERKSLFFIIAGNDDLWNMKEQIYDFKDHCIEPDILETSICTSSRRLLQLGFNFYNGHATDSVLDTFSGLDHDNFKLALEAIKLRFHYTDL